KPVMKSRLTRREFIQAGLAGAAGAALAPRARAEVAAAAQKSAAKLVAKADAVIHIWMPGGVAQSDTWDPKKYTPYKSGMKGSELLGTCEPIPTSADGVFIGKGLDHVAKV